MRRYEVVVIFDAALEDGVIRELTDRVVQLVRSRGGVSGHVERWGRRTFAYEMNHHSDGYYVLIEVTAEPAVLAEVDRMLALADEVLRHKVIRQPDGSKLRGAAAAGGATPPSPEPPPVPQ